MFSEIKHALHLIKHGDLILRNKLLESHKLP